MKTVRKLIYRQLLSMIALVTVGFLALFFFIDLVEELRRTGKGGYGAMDAALTCLLNMPVHAYDIFPIALLIGAILALSQLAQSTEFTILRTSGLGPGRALMLLGGLGLAATLLMAAVGELLVPRAEQWRSLHQAQFRASEGLKLGRSGAWLREQHPDSGGLITVNVGTALGDRDFRDVRIYEFDGQGRLTRRLAAGGARIAGEDTAGSVAGTRQTLWQLQDVEDTAWTAPQDSARAPIGATLVQVRRSDSLTWPSTLSAEVVAASVLSIDSMTTLNLWRYSEHLNRNLQDARRHEIYLWKRLMAPWACLVMVALALPFAYLHTRQSSPSLKIFGGIMVGISFVLANHIAGHLGLLHAWTPWVVASLPPLTYLLLAMATFLWLIRFR